jgi:hypothetical protein
MKRRPLPRIAKRPASGANAGLMVLCGLAGLAVGLLLTQTCKASTSKATESAKDPLEGMLGAGMLRSTPGLPSSAMGMRLEMQCLAEPGQRARNLDAVDHAFDAFEAAALHPAARRALNRLLKPMGGSK